MPTANFNHYFPDYEILGELGRSNARVLKAKHKQTGQLVAIKHFAFNTDADTIRRFQRESEIMTSIDHPNVVRIQEVRFDADLPYIVMELIEGGDVRSLLKKDTYLDVATTIRLGLQMAEALKVIHDRGIIHRDIKPDNIMYRRLQSGELHFLLTDFGIAKLREQSNTLTGQSPMTYEYASPEQLDNPKGVDAATDYYSLGVVFYECLTGKVPFSTDELGMRKFMHSVAEVPPPMLASVTSQPLPDGLNELVEGLLSKDVSERVAEIDHLVFSLEQARFHSIMTRMGKTNPYSQPKANRTTIAPGKENIPPKPQAVDLTNLLAEANQYYQQKKYKEAYDLYTKAASQGNAEAQSNLGWMYQHGQCVAKDYQSAFFWYQKAANQGFAAAQNNLGSMYFYGQHVEEDYQQALKWYKNAASGGSAAAQNNLGYIYHKGERVEKNITEAVKWYQLAAKQNHSEAIDALRQLGYDADGNKLPKKSWFS